jgi:hypothetical protein
MLWHDGARPPRLPAADPRVRSVSEESAAVRCRRDRFDDGWVGRRGWPGERNLFARRGRGLGARVCIRIAHAYRRDVVARWGADRRLASASDTGARDRDVWVVRAVPCERLGHCGLGPEGGAADSTATLHEVQRWLTLGSDRKPRWASERIEPSLALWTSVVNRTRRVGREIEGDATAGALRRATRRVAVGPGVSSRRTIQGRAFVVRVALAAATARNHDPLGRAIAGSDSRWRLGNIGVVLGHCPGIDGANVLCACEYALRARVPHVDRHAIRVGLTGLVVARRLNFSAPRVLIHGATEHVAADIEAARRGSAGAYACAKGYASDALAACGHACSGATAPACHPHAGSATGQACAPDGHVRTTDRTRTAAATGLSTPAADSHRRDEKDRSESSHRPSLEHTACRAGSHEPSANPRRSTCQDGPRVIELSQWRRPKPTPQIPTRSSSPSRARPQKMRRTPLLGAAGPQVPQLYVNVRSRSS